VRCVFADSQSDCSSSRSVYPLHNLICSVLRKTNDPSNPHLLRAPFRREIEKLTGWDLKYFRFGPSHKGIERTWTEELSDNNGDLFLVRFIILDEETTHMTTQGCTYYYDPTVSTGFRPRLTRDSTLPCPDLDYIEDFEAPKRPFYGDDQLDWFREQVGDSFHSECCRHTIVCTHIFFSSFPMPFSS
jgi:hypothetical protein